MSLSRVSMPLSGERGTGQERLLPHLAEVVVEHAELSGGHLRVWARARADQAACPWCGHVSAAAQPVCPAAGRCRDRRVVIWLRVRRLFCDDPGCGHKTFAEQVPGLTARGRHARLGRALGCERQIRRVHRCG